MSNLNGTGSILLPDTNGNIITISGITGGTWGHSIAYATGAGTSVTSLTGDVISSSNSRKRIGPKLYFSYVKSKLNKTEVKKLRARLTKLQTLTKDAEELGQEALHQELAKMLACVVRESEVAACGYDIWIDQKDINKFMGMVSENDKSYDKIIYFKKLEDFPRAIPERIKKKIVDVKNKNIFDEFHVLYLSYKEDNLKTNKEKIREKDPILFGKFSYQADRYYYVTDWVDDHCDLSLESFIEKLKVSDPEYQVHKTPEIDTEYVDRIKQEVLERHQRLTNTKPGNFRELMKEEDKEPNKQTLKKKIWWKFWRRK